MQLKSTLVKAIVRLNSEEAALEAQLLLQHVLNVNRAWLISHEKDVLTSDQYAAFETLLQRRLNGEPIAYILGAREFYGLNLKVTPDTLIPRPDTEMLVEAALAKIPKDKAFKILDLGTGTGAISLAIAKNRPQAQVIAVDFSESALKVAQENAENLNIQNVTFLQSSWFSALGQQRFDMIVSNPPYIEEADTHLSQGDLRFEPKSALTSGEDGLDDIRHIVSNCLVHLAPQGWLMFEHGYNQAQAVEDLMSAEGLVDITTIQDLGGNDRVTSGKNPLIVSQHWG
jgi:release factor glutamine methyltransferase